jgi:hypothetical protein
MYKPVAISVSSKQLSKLRNGHKVRVKKPMEGEGICLVVSPENYSIIDRTFSKGKGGEIALGADELMANRNLSPEDHQKMASAMGMVSGSGIFGKKFDRAVGKLIGKNARREIYKRAEEYKPLIKGGITTGLTAGAASLGAMNPALIPYLPMAVGGLSSLAYDYLDRPSYYQGDTVKKNAKRYANDKALEMLNEELGTNMGNMSRAGVESALANKLQAQQAEETYRRDVLGYGLYAGGSGSGLYAGGGLGLGLGLGMCGGRVRPMSRTGGNVGLNAGMVNKMPPALQSQPYGANFQFQHTLPPSYQKFSR